MPHQLEAEPKLMTTTYGSLSVTIPYPGGADEHMAVELVTTPRRKKSMFGVRPVMMALTVLLVTTVASFVAISARSSARTTLSQPSSGPKHQVVLDREEAWWNPFSHSKGELSTVTDKKDHAADADEPSSTATTGGASSTTPHATSCGDCTLEECKPLLCDLAHTPYTCTAGFSKGGCAPSQNAFTNANCQSCCSLAKCVEKAPSCPPCEPSQCLSIRQSCGLKRPYACTAGGSKGACSDDAKEWPLNILKGTCDSCCDVTKCPPVEPCGICTPEECSAVKAGCTKQRPWACVEGPAKGGCSAKESYWTDAELTGMCEKCCDSSKCPADPPTTATSEKAVRKNKVHL